MSLEPKDVMSLTQGDDDTEDEERLAAMLSPDEKSEGEADDDEEEEAGEEEDDDDDDEVDGDDSDDDEEEAEFQKTLQSDVSDEEATDLICGARTQNPVLTMFSDEDCEKLADVMSVLGFKVRRQPATQPPHLCSSTHLCASTAHARSVASTGVTTHAYVFCVPRAQSHATVAPAGRRDDHEEIRGGDLFLYCAPRRRAGAAAPPPGRRRQHGRRDFLRRNGLL